MSSGAVAATAAVPRPVGAAAPGDPTLTMNSRTLRGLQMPVHAGNLVAGQDYTLGATDGVFGNHQSSVTKTASDQGALDARFTLPPKTPYITSLTVTLSLASDPSTTLAQQDVIVTKPILTVDEAAGPSACPGKNTVPTGTNFPPGTYTFSSDVATFSPDTVTAPSDVLGSAAKSAGAHLHMSLPLDLPTRFHVTATSDAATYHFVLHRYHQSRALDSQRSTPWRHYWSSECFRPGEKLTYGPVPPHGSLRSAPATADANGRIRFVTDEHPGAHPTAVTEITVTGQQSGERTGTDPVKLPGTTLVTGETDVDPGAVILQSSRPGYMFEQDSCYLSVTHYVPGGGRRVVWRSGKPGKPRPAICLLALTRHGNLTLTSRGGKVVWQSHSHGSDGGNRLVMRGSGALLIYDASGNVVWSARDGGTKWSR